MSYSMGNTSNILDLLRTDGKVYNGYWCFTNGWKAHIYLLKGLLASKIAVYLFPLVALVTSVPVFTIIIRSNLLRGRICNKYWAQVWASGIPWIIAMWVTMFSYYNLSHCANFLHRVLQTSDQLNMFLNWTSLFLQSVTMINCNELHD